MDELRDSARLRNDHRDGKHRDQPNRQCDRAGCNPWNGDDEDDEDE
jgi:hypothetical protein